MFDLGMQELIVIFAVALLVFGPKKLPELSRALGKGIRELKIALRGVKDSIDEAESTVKDSIDEAETAIEESVYKEAQPVVPEGEKNKENQKTGAEQDTDAVKQDTDAGIKEKKKEKADNG